MRDILNKFFGSRDASKHDAKARLKFLLIHDQVDLTPAQLESMKTEILEVIARYMDVDKNEAEVKLEREHGTVALVSNFPVRRVTARAV